jgi:hypothetical protein
MIFFSIHFVIICDVLFLLIYETHLTLSVKSRCDTWMSTSGAYMAASAGAALSAGWAGWHCFPKWARVRVLSRGVLFLFFLFLVFILI